MRRSSVSLSALATGTSPLPWYPAAMKASIGFADRVAPPGTSGRSTGCSDQSRAARASSGWAARLGAKMARHTQRNGRIGEYSLSNYGGDNHFEQAAHAIVAPNG